MGIGDFFEGAGKAIGRAANDAWNANRGIGESATAVIGGGLHVADKLMHGVQRGIEHPEGVPNQLWNANREIGDAGVATTKGVAKAGQFVAEHPVESYKIGNAVSKKIIMDQLNPVNIGLLLATGGASAVAAGAEGVTAGYEAFKGGSTALEAIQEGRSAITGARTASEIAEGGVTARKLFSGPTKYAEGATEEAGGFGGAANRYSNWKTNTVGDLREKVGLGRTGMFQQGRASLAEEWGQRVGSEGFFNEQVMSRVANAPGAPTTGGRFAEWQYEAKQGLGATSKAKQARTGLHALADPKRAALDFGKKELSTHKDDIVHGIEKHAGDQIVSTVKDKIFGNKDDQRTSDSTVQPAQAQSVPGYEAWQRSDDSSSGGFVASKPQGGGAVTSTSATAPESIGPSNWYGQQGYSTGRGFQPGTGQQQWGTTAWNKDPAFA